MIVFEDLVDDLRSGELDAAGRRQLSMVLQSQRGARMDLAMLDLFDEPRQLSDDDYDVADLVGGVLARLDAERPSGVAPPPRLPFDPIAAPERASEPSGVVRSERVAGPPAERLPFDPLPAPAPASTPAPEPEPPRATFAATREALGKPRLSRRPMTTTQKLAVQLERRPFLRPYLAAAVVLLSLSMGWTARGLFAGAPEPVVAPTKAPVVTAEPETRALGSDDLLAFAENAVARDQHARAARLYQELLRRFPRSPEAGMAQLGLARLQLEELADPAAAAASYGAFLDAHPDDDLAPDAALGRARALDAAGSGDAAAAWRAIEERFPESEAATLGRRQR